MIDHFGLLAPIYDRVIGPPDPARLRHLLDLPAAGRLLDAGGGTGRVSSQLRALVDELVINDASAKMLHQAQGKGLQHAIQGRVEQLPFPDASFDRIMVIDALHHFQDQKVAARDLVRVLKVGGTLVIEEPNIARPAVKLVALVEKLALMGSHFHTPEEIRSMVLRPGVSATIGAEGHAAWVVVHKSVES